MCVLLQKEEWYEPTLTSLSSQAAITFEPSDLTRLVPFLNVAFGNTHSSCHLSCSSPHSTVWWSIFQFLGNLIFFTPSSLRVFHSEILSGRRCLLRAVRESRLKCGIIIKKRDGNSPFHSTMSIVCRSRTPFGPSSPHSRAIWSSIEIIYHETSPKKESDYQKISCQVPSGEWGPQVKRKPTKKKHNIELIALSRWSRGNKMICN